MRWCIFYDGGATFSDSNGSPFEAPARGVLVIVVADQNHRWRTVCGKDFYVWDNRGKVEGWWCVDHFGLYDYLIEPGAKRVLFGRETTNEEFSRVLRSAREYFGLETAHYPGERHD